MKEFCILNNHGLAVKWTNLNPYNQCQSESVCSHPPSFPVYLLNTFVSQSNKLQVTRSNCCKMLTKLLQELLRVNVFRKGVLRLLGCSVAALKVSDLDSGKTSKQKKKPYTTHFIWKKIKDRGVLKRNELPFQTEWRD